MMDCECITLENGIEYIVAATTEIDSIKYYLLVNPNNRKDFMIRKEDGDEIIGLDDKLEFATVTSDLLQKNIDNQYLQEYVVNYIKYENEKNNQ